MHITSYLLTQAELKRCLQEEARLNKPKARDLSISETLGCVPGNNSSEDEELLALERDQTFDGDHGKRYWGAEQVFRFKQPSVVHTAATAL